MLRLDEVSHLELLEGLSAPHATIAPKYLYDERGCRLFELITGLPEYYPTRTERAVLERNGTAIGAAAGVGAALIDLGAGNCRKARSLFPLLHPRCYVAVDISAEFVRQSLDRVQAEFPEIAMAAVGADLTADFALPAAINGTRRVFFYPGSSIGNLEAPAALALLTRIRRHCRNNGGLLIGIDLVKDTPVLHAAYNDESGITAAFNLNVLSHLNALLGANFSLSDWRHRAFYNAACSRVEMHLDAVRDTEISWPGGHRRFAAGESIHTENSYKYRLEDFTDLLHEAGFAEVSAWTDARRWFALCYAGA